jgi:hypothetical protein
MPNTRKLRRDMFEVFTAVEVAQTPLSYIETLIVTPV